MRVPWNRGGIRTYLLLVGLLAGKTTPFWVVLGLPFLLTGIAAHIWAKGCLHQNREVTSSGPYRYVRHPFYFANALIDVAVALMSGWWPLMIVLPLWWTAVYIPVMRREENVMLGIFGDAYRKYAARTPRIIPRGLPRGSTSGGFSWGNPNLARTEFPRALRLVCYPMLFLIAGRIFEEGLGWIRTPSTGDIHLVAMFFGVYLSGGIMRKHFKLGKRLTPEFCGRAWVRFIFLAAVIAVGFVLNSFEVDAEWVLWPLGLGIMTFAFAGFVKKGWSVSVEVLLVLGGLLLFELPWLAALMLPVCLALFLEHRKEGAGRGAVNKGLVFPVEVYSLILITVLVLPFLKELWNP